MMFYTNNGTNCGIFTDEKSLGRSSTNQKASIILAKQTISIMYVFRRIAIKTGKTK
jgi:hypothetical protein